MDKLKILTKQEDVDVVKYLFRLEDNNKIVLNAGLAFGGTEKMIKYLRRTYKNKAVALGLAGIGYLSTFIDGDATGCAFLMLIAVPLFFARRNHID